MLKNKLSVVIIVIIILFASAFYLSRKNEIATNEEKRGPIEVGTQSVMESKFITENRNYPGTVVGDQEIAVISQISGNITSIPYEIGSPIKIGALLARIDDAGALVPGDSGFKSNQIQQSELTAQQAKKTYGLTKDTYQDIKNSGNATKIQKESAKTQKEIAKLQYEASQINLQGTIDNHILRSPINGYIINKNVSVGDSVSPGQIIATVSRTSAVKIQFYVDQTEKSAFSTGQALSVFDSTKNRLEAIVKNISIQADPQTKRFLIEAYPKKQDSLPLLLGTIVTVSLEKKQTPQNNNNILLPLSAITITQNESFIFIEENGLAKKIPVEILRIIGENAEIITSLTMEQSIIVRGNKILREGESILIKNGS